MLSFLSPELAAFLALVTMALLPGLLVVRSPWTTVPALSVAFWILSWWWLPLGSRSQLVGACLALFGILALFRLLPRQVVPPPPDYDGPAPGPPVSGPLTGEPPPLRSLPSLMVVLAALVMLMPLPLWPHLPGREMAFHTTSARLASWRDGLPATYEPLLPVAPFGAHAPALPTLAADLVALGGLDPGPALSAVALLLPALCLLGLFALVGTRLDPAASALAALLGLAVVPRGFLAVWGEGGPLLALALVLSAAALLQGHTSRPSAVAAGMLLAAGLLAQPLLALALGAVVVAWTGGSRSRNALAVAVALVLAAPALWPLVQAVSVHEVLGTLTSPVLAELADLALGVVGVGLALTIARRLAPLPGPGRALDALLAAASAVLLVVGVHVRPSTNQLGDASLRALADLAKDVRPLEPVCAPDDLEDWVPALGGRPLGRPVGSAASERALSWLPPVLRDEAAKATLAPCTKTLDP